MKSPLWRGPWNWRPAPCTTRWDRETNELFRELLQRLDAAYPALHYRQICVGVDNYQIHKAKDVEPWVAKHPWGERLFLPTDCPRANPIERDFGDVHDLCTRHHTRKRLRDLVADRVKPLPVNGSGDTTCRRCMTIRRSLQRWRE